MHASIERYLMTLESKGRVAVTLKMVHQDLNRFVVWWEQRRRRIFDPALLRFEDLRDWRNARQHEGKAPSTINRGLAVVRGYCNWATLQGIMTTNPGTDLKDVPTQPLAPRSLPADAIDALLREVLAEEDPAMRLRDQAILALLVYTGLRVQEVCDVQIRDLDLAASTLIVRSGKGGKARRVPLYPDAQRILCEYLELVRCPKGRPRLGSAEETEPLLGGKDITLPGHPFKPGVNQRMLQRLIHTLGQLAAQRLRNEAKRESDIRQAEHLQDLARQLDRATPHMLRHSLAKRLLDSGAKLTEVQRVLGHSRLDTTARYLTPSEEDLRAAILKAGV